jgi:hypothetical protein
MLHLPPIIAGLLYLLDLFPTFVQFPIKVYRNPIHLYQTERNTYAGLIYNFLNQYFLFLNDNQKTSFLRFSNHWSPLKLFLDFLDIFNFEYFHKEILAFLPKTQEILFEY